MSLTGKQREGGVASLEGGANWFFPPAKLQHMMDRSRSYIYCGHNILDRVRKSAEGGAPVASQLVQPMQSGPFEKKISEGKMQLGLVGENTIWDVYL